MSAAIEEFGPYVVYEQLGQGGMATVHRAEKRGVGIRRPIALKRLLPHVAADPDLVKLFVDEARLASHLHHANVAQTYELGRVGDTFFIAMEYASGPTLSQIVRQCQKAAGEIPQTVTVNIIAQVCEALDYAHNLCDESGRALRIIHRDVSPANILVTNTGIVKLIDFGIAKATISSVKTQTGFIKGKFGYIAPEYITGKIDARVDLFAIGVVAHEMLTGRRLFEGKDDFETLANIREMVMQPPSHWNPHVTTELDDIVMTALQRDPDKRWQSAAAMQVALHNVARDFGVVVGSQQLVEWVEWAFTQVPRASGPMLSADPLTGDTDGGGRDPDTLGRDSNLSIEVERPSVDGVDAATPPPRSRRAPSPSDLDETVALDRVRMEFNDLEVVTPPAMAAAPLVAAQPTPGPTPPPSAWMMGSAEPVGPSSSGEWTPVLLRNGRTPERARPTTQHPPPPLQPPPSPEPPLSPSQPQSPPQLPWITLQLPVVSPQPTPTSSRPAPPQPPLSPPQPPPSPPQPPPSPSQPPLSPPQPPPSPSQPPPSPPQPPPSPPQPPPSPSQPPPSPSQPPPSPPQPRPASPQPPPAPPHTSPSPPSPSPPEPPQLPWMTLPLPISPQPPPSPQPRPAPPQPPPSPSQPPPSPSQPPPSPSQPPPSPPQLPLSPPQLPWMTLPLPVSPQPPPPEPGASPSFNAGTLPSPQPPPVPPPRMSRSSDPVAPPPPAPSMSEPVAPPVVSAPQATAAAIPAVPPSREIEVIVVPPGSMFEMPAAGPAEVAKPAPAAKPGKQAKKSKPAPESKLSPAQKAKPASKPSTKAESEPRPATKAKPEPRPATKAKPEPRPATQTEAKLEVTSAKARRRDAPTGTYPIAPRRRRTVLWLILLMIALGAGAMAAAYFWLAEL